MRVENSLLEINIEQKFTVVSKIDLNFHLTYMSFMQPAQFMQLPPTVIVQQPLVEELLEVKKKQKT